LITPAYLSSKPGILSQPPALPEENLSRYFFFFLPAFFFILVLSLDLDFVAERFFLLTGIDTSYTVAAAGQASETFWLTDCRSSPALGIIETCSCKINNSGHHLERNFKSRRILAPPSVSPD
jgi:hypothetical protein